MTNGDILEYTHLLMKLTNMREIAKDFRENTSLGSVIREYEARIKHYSNK